MTVFGFGASALGCYQHRTLTCITSLPSASASAGAKAFEEASSLAQSLHLPGIRDGYRALLLSAKSSLEAALETRPFGAEGEAKAAEELRVQHAWEVTCREVLLRVYWAFAEDARYGVGQLSRAAQRAPSEADCDDGWERVEDIARGAEDVAALAAALVSETDPSSFRELASRTQRSARAARGIIVGRNPAYTFHANPAFSFGEGWYAAAAAVLGGVTLQIEPGQKHTAAAERFLLGAGLGPQLQSYHSRPRANKALPLVVADGFRRDRDAAQARLREAFLAGSNVVPLVRAWLRARLAAHPSRPTVLVWNRQCRHHAHRNSCVRELIALCRWSSEVGLCPILIGDGLADMRLPEGTLDLTLFWKEPLFQGLDMRRAQLELFEQLRAEWGLVGQVGVTTAGMDGPALLGLPTLYITDEPNVRLGRWVGAVPNYEEVIRDAAYETRITSRLAAWPRGVSNGPSHAIRS